MGQPSWWLVLVMPGYVLVTESVYGVNTSDWVLQGLRLANAAAIVPTSMSLWLHSPEAGPP